MRDLAIGSVLAFLALAQVSTAWADDRGQWATLENDASCQIWNDESQRGQTVTWSGTCENGRAAGPGVATRRYYDHGQWKESRFEGELFRGKARGRGTMSSPDGAKYEGEWFDGLRDGQGVTLFSNGDRYEGSHQEGTFDGMGAYTWSEGDRYVGAFKANQMHGYGIYVYIDGGIYAGDWVDGSKEGQGRRLWADGSQFEGAFVAGNPHGDGNCRNAGGESGICRYAYGEFQGWQ